MSPQDQDSILVQDMHPLSNLISPKSTQKRGKPFAATANPENIVSEELRQVLSPEACGWLEGWPMGGGKGKKPSAESRLGAPSQTNQANQSPYQSNEKAAFDALSSSYDGVDFLESADPDAHTEEPSVHIPSGTLIEVRRYVHFQTFQAIVFGPTSLCLC